MLVEGYDMGLGRRLVAGVDVWLNNPIYPQEASGTSGMKAAINGAINLSVLDGWWAEGYDEQQKNGWAIKPNLNEVQRNLEDSHALYEILQDQVVPLYYGRGKMGFSEGWVEKAKRSIATVLPRFNASRMVGEYVSRFYFPAARNGRIYADKDFDSARILAAWKAKIRQRWSGVTLRRVDTPKKRIPFGDALRFEVALRLNGLSSDDVLVELLVNRSASSEWLEADVRRFRFNYDGQGSGDDHLFTLDLAPDLCGKLEYRIRVYPFHSLLTHPMEMGLMVWL
jgi:alpha-glucan phosphorylases